MFLCSGAAGMVPISLPSIESLIDNMYSDFGSLHVSRDRVIKQSEYISKTII